MSTWQLQINRQTTPSLATCLNACMVSHRRSSGHPL